MCCHQFCSALGLYLRGPRNNDKLWRRGEKKQSKQTRGQSTNNLLIFDFLLKYEFIYLFINNYAIKKKQILYYSCKLKAYWKVDLFPPSLCLFLQMLLFKTAANDLLWQKLNTLYYYGTIMEFLLITFVTSEFYFGPVKLYQREIDQVNSDFKLKLDMNNPWSSYSILLTYLSPQTGQMYHDWSGNRLWYEKCLKLETTFSAWPCCIWDLFGFNLMFEICTFSITLHSLYFSFSIQFYYTTLTLTLTIDQHRSVSFSHRLMTHCPLVVTENNVLLLFVFDFCKHLCYVTVLYSCTIHIFLDDIGEQRVMLFWVWV